MRRTPVQDYLDSVPDKVHQLYVDEGLSLTKLAKLLKVDERRLRFWLTRHNYPISGPGRRSEALIQSRKNLITTPDYRELEQRVLDLNKEGLTLEAIAKKLEQSNKKIWGILKRNGLTRTHQKDVLTGEDATKRLDKYEDAVKDLAENNVTINRIAERYNVSYWDVQHWLKFKGIPAPSKRVPPETRQAIIDDRAQDEDVNTIQFLAKKYDVGVGTVHRILSERNRSR